MGVIDLGRADTRLERPRPGQIVGTPEQWVETLVRLYAEYRQDTFLFWPIAGDEMAQLEVFAGQVVPTIRAAIAALSVAAEVAGIASWGPLIALLVSVYFGLEGAALRVAALRRRGWREWGVVHAEGLDEAQARFAYERELQGALRAPRW